MLSLKKDNIAQKKNLIALKLALSTRLDFVSRLLDFVSRLLDLPPRLSDFLLSDRACSATTDEIFAKASPFDRLSIGVADALSIWLGAVFAIGLLLFALPFLLMQE